MSELSDLILLIRDLRKEGAISYEKQNSIVNLLEGYARVDALVKTGELPWRPISELTTETRYDNGFLLLAPELVDLDCNPCGAGMGYWQDDGLLWHASQEECDKCDRDKDYGSWMACKWSMTNDEWYHACCNPTHYLRLRGAS